MSKHRESFVRWQGITIEQLGYAINLFLTFATASLGFSLFEFKSPSGSWLNCGKCFLFCAIVFFLISVGIGAWCVINRLQDFRKTKDIARGREDLMGKLSTEELEKYLQPLRTETQKLGEKTWALFRVQIASFLFGLFFLVLAMVVIYCFQS